MERIASIIAGKLVALDTSPFIYYIEEHPDYLSLTNTIFETIDAGGCAGVTSVLTLLEVQVRPLREGRHDLADDYREILANSSNLLLASMTADVAARAARLRAKYDWLRTPDAIQLATAMEYGADIVITNDVRWRGVSELSVMVLRDYLAASP